MKDMNEEPKSEVDDGAPLVPLPAAGAPFVLLIGLLVLAIGLFVFLEGRRKPVARDVAAAAAAIASAPPLRFPSAPLEEPPPPPPPPPPPEIRYVERPAPPPEIRYVERPTPMEPPPPPTLALGRLADPALVIDLAEADGADSPVRAAKLRNRGALVLQGAMIPAVLETPIDTDRAGPVRAIVSEDTRGFDGTRVLIPKGSRVLGEVRDGGGSGRAVINWSRLVRPDGVTIRINAPATDALGGAGVTGTVDNHTLARVSGMALQTAFAIGANLASQPRNGAVIVSTSGQALGNMGQVLVPRSESRPSVRVKKGAAITIFVTRDLDFGGAVVP